MERYIISWPEWWLRAWGISFLAWMWIYAISEIVVAAWNKEASNE